MTAIGSPLRSEEIGKLQRERFHVRQFALPYDQHAPSGGMEGRHSLSIAGGIARKFRSPIIDARFRNIAPPAAVVLMPKAAMHENHFPVPWKYKVRRARHVASVEPEAKTETVCRAPDRKFGTAAFTPDSGHQGAALFSRKRVHGRVLSHARLRAYRRRRSNQRGRR